MREREHDGSREEPRNAYEREPDLLICLRGLLSHFVYDRPEENNKILNKMV
uniref:Uncharacterized protein n=1 Tax=Oryza brachyantha TaxID=4533 RepID=J3KUD5_ORYBR